MNTEKEIEGHVKEIMKLLDIKIDDSNKDTPRRIAKMWCRELFLNRNNNLIEILDSQMKVFENTYCNDMVVLKDIPFNSTCEHHWLPFSGKISIGYVPKNSVVGLSKIPRVVEYFSKQPQLQEKLSQDIGEYLFDILDPQFLIVFIESTHSCVACRGVEKDCKTITQYTKINPATKTPIKEFIEEFNRLRR